MSAPLLYFEIDPPDDLTDSVLAFWGFEVRRGAPPVHTLWPDASLTVTWGMHGQRTTVLTALGARTTSVSVPVQPGSSYRGIRFQPDAARRVFGLDPRSARDGRLPLEALGAVGERLAGAASQAASLRDAFRLFEEATRSSASGADEPDPLVRGALHSIDEAPDRPIASIAGDLGLSDRQLRRRFVHETGLAPKEYARIRRLRTTLGRLLDGRERWSTIAAGSGFADQAHLVNEIVRMTAYTPRMLQDRLRLIEHVGVTP